MRLLNNSNLCTICCTITSIATLVSLTQATSNGPDWTSSSSSSYCDNLEDQIGPNGRWKTYDFVMDNCLVRRFINMSAEDMDFYPLLYTLDNLVEEILTLYKSKFDTQLQPEGHEISRTQHQLMVKVVNRELKRERLIFNKLLDDIRLKVSLVESAINDSMDKCTLHSSSLIGGGGTSLNSHCPNTFSDTKVMVRTLCQLLRTQNALIKSKILSLKLMNN